MNKYEVNVSGHAECTGTHGRTANADFSFTVTIEADGVLEAESEAQDMAHGLIRQLEVTSCSADAYEI